jgi:hypothetical protein
VIAALALLAGAAIVARVANSAPTTTTLEVQPAMSEPPQEPKAKIEVMPVMIEGQLCCGRCLRPRVQGTAAARRS